MRQGRKRLKLRLLLLIHAIILGSRSDFGYRPCPLQSFRPRVCNAKDIKQEKKKVFQKVSVIGYCIIICDPHDTGYTTSTKAMAPYQLPPRLRIYLGGEDLCNGMYVNRRAPPDHRGMSIKSEPGSIQNKIPHPNNASNEGLSKKKYSSSYG